MIIWGSRGKSLDLGFVGTEHCVTCEKPRPFHLYLQYRYGHLYWIFRAVTRKEYLKACEVCHRGVKLDTKQTEATFQKHPIPFVDRFGLLLVGVAVVLVIGLAMVSN
jgi:hypothetical protein